MLIYFFALLAAALILLANDYRNETNRWAAFFLIFASIGGTANDLSAAGYASASAIVQFLNHTLTPYGVLMFSLVYSDRCPNARTRLRMKGLLLIPVVAMALSTPLTMPLRIDFIWLLVWTAPYYLLSCWWLLSSFWREKDPRRKRSRFVVTLIVVPTLLAVLVLINIENAVSPGFDYFRYISLFLVYSLSVAVLFTFLYGVLGVKLRFERDPLESAMKAAVSGTALLNHTIKNEIGKIAISSENLKQSLPENDEKAEEHLRIISNASDHMLAMVSRIHSQLKDIVLHEEPCRLDLLADEVASQHRWVLESHGVDLTTAYSVRPTVICDTVHIKEAVGNVLRNAVEAMPDGGRIVVAIEAGKRDIHLSIQDTGPGIPADRLAQVFEPFFSTKNGRMNFGLGLSYVYNVMRKSGGSAGITAADKVGGTLVTLRFPRRKRIVNGQGERL